ncbi:MAG TPA: hypothetical protein VK635_17200 [Bradyrhizobium sp.]|jgi:hypothetical protein|nr:hypothetical protein [Bradyrhizobium sp.]
MILTGAADGRVAPKATVGRKEGWRAGDRKEWEQFSRLNEGFDLSSMSEDAPLIGHHRRRQNRRE